MCATVVARTQSSMKLTYDKTNQTSEFPDKVCCLIITRVYQY